MQNQRFQARRPWPFPPSPRPGGSQLPRLSRGAMLGDILLAVIWGASIPGLMWLGAAGGF